MKLWILAVSVFVSAVIARPALADDSVYQAVGSTLTSIGAANARFGAAFPGPNPNSAGLSSGTQSALVSGGAVITSVLTNAFNLGPVASATVAGIVASATTMIAAPAAVKATGDIATLAQISLTGTGLANLHAAQWVPSGLMAGAQSLVGGVYDALLPNEAIDSIPLLAQKAALVGAWNAAILATGAWLSTWMSGVAAPTLAAIGSPLAVGAAVAAGTVVLSNLIYRVYNYCQTHDCTIASGRSSNTDSNTNNSANPNQSVDSNSSGNGNSNNQGNTNSNSDNSNSSNQANNNDNAGNRNNSGNSNGNSGGYGNSNNQGNTNQPNTNQPNTNQPNTNQGDTNSISGNQASGIITCPPGGSTYQTVADVEPTLKTYYVWCDTPYPDMRHFLIGIRYVNINGVDSFIPEPNYNYTPGGGASLGEFVPAYTPNSAPTSTPPPKTASAPPPNSGPLSLKQQPGTPPAATMTTATNITCSYSAPLKAASAVNGVSQPATSQSQTFGVAGACCPATWCLNNDGTAPIDPGNGAVPVPGGQCNSNQGMGTLGGAWNLSGTPLTTATCSSGGTSSQVQACKSNPPFLPWGGNGSASITVSGGQSCNIGWHDTPGGPGGVTVLDSMSVTSPPSRGTAVVSPQDHHVIIFTAAPPPKPGEKPYTGDSFTLSIQEHNGGRKATMSVKVSVTIQ